MNAKLNDIVSRAFDETWETAQSARAADARRRLRPRRAARRRGDRRPGASTRNRRSSSSPRAAAISASGPARVVTAAQEELGFELRGGRHRRRPRARGRVPRVDPGGRDRRPAPFRLPRPPGRAARGRLHKQPARSLLVQREPSCYKVDQRREVAWRSPDRRRRRPPVPVPPGADAGAEDGEDADLLAGDRRVHEHQRDPDPPRPLELRQVRQARRRLLHRLAARRDPQDPAHAGPAQHRARRRRPARPGDRRARRSSPSTASTSPPSSTPTRGEDRAADRPRLRSSEYDRLAELVRDKNIIVGVLAVPGRRRAAGGRRPRRRRRARSSSTTPRRCSRRPPT